MRFGPLPAHVKGALLTTHNNKRNAAKGVGKTTIRTMYRIFFTALCIANGLGTCRSFTAAPQSRPRTPTGTLDVWRGEHIDSYNNNRHSAADWWYNVKSINKSKVLQEVRNPVIAVGGWGLAVSVIHMFLRSSSKPLLQSLGSQMCIPGTAHSFLVSALGLLLVFRTNSAYQRFYEGRKIWENILSVSRNMSRMIQVYKHDIGEKELERIRNLVAAYPYLLRQHIRPGCLCTNPKEIPKKHRLLLTEHVFAHHETRHEGQEDGPRGPLPWVSECWVDKRDLPWKLFRPSSLPLVSTTENRPVWVCDRLAALIARVPYGPNFTSRERLALFGMVDKLTNAVGQCERIHQTAVPLNYARHSLRSLTVWLFTLPFALVGDLGLFTAPAVASVAWLFFGVYQIGYSIEDPFQGSLRLSILCDTIRRNVLGTTRNTAFDNIADSPRVIRFDTLPSVVPPTAAPKIIQLDNGTWTEVGI